MKNTRKQPEKRNGPNPAYQEVPNEPSLKNSNMSGSFEQSERIADEEKKTFQYDTDGNSKNKLVLIPKATMDYPFEGKDTRQMTGEYHNQPILEKQAAQEPSINLELTNNDMKSKSVGANQIIPSDKSSMQQYNKEWWPMTIYDQQQSQGFNNGLNDNDVFPMSVNYTQNEKRTITITRLVTLLVIIFVLIPINSYYTVPGTRLRLGYFATDYYYHKIEFSKLSSNGFTSTLANCKVNWKVQETSSTTSFGLEYVFLFGTTHNFDGTSLKIISSELSNDCIINFYLPANNIGLPRFAFTMFGESDQQEFRDFTPASVALNFSGGIQVVGQTAHFNLENHIISSLNISLTLSYCYLKQIRLQKSNIRIGTGVLSIHFPADYKKNLVSLNQPSGYICTYSPLANINSSLCSKASLAKSSCTINGYLCNNGVDTCSSSGLIPESTMTLSLDDGPLQVRYNSEVFTTNGPATNYTPSVEYNSSIIFSKLSTTLLNNSLTGYLLNSVSDRVSQLNIAGVEYQRTWSYTNRLVYFQSQFWSIIWASLGLLKPYMDDQFLNVIDSNCPARDISMLQYTDMDVKNYLKKFYPQNFASEVALVKGYSGFLRVLQDNVGVITYNDILIDENPLIIGAFAISAAIAVVGTFLIVQGAYMAFKVGTKKYGEWVQARRQFAITKKQFEVSQEKGGSYEESINFEMQASQNKVEVRGILHSYLRPMTQQELKKNLQYQFSVFYIPTLFIEYSLRQNVDSLALFLLKIPINKEQFSVIKQDRKQNVTIPLEDFQKVYSQFCIREGYIEGDLQSEDAIAVFNHFMMKLDDNQGQEQPAYGNIRFKSMKEKSALQAVGKEGLSFIEQFLEDECVQSQFPNDFIYYKDLRDAFDAYCQKLGTEASQQENIIGSEYLAQFGAVKRDAPPPMHLFGVKFDQYAEDLGPQNNFGLIRIPSDRKMNNFSGLLKPEGIIANCVMTMVHVILIISIPIATPIISFQALSAQTIISEDIHSTKITLQDTYMANYLNPWWENVPGIKYWLYIQISIVIFVFFAIIELISFYFTGLLNLGKYPVIYTIEKKAFNLFFKIILAIFLFAYVMMLWFGLVWAVLAAIINPTSFLPYAAASITLFATVTSKIIYYRSEYSRVIKRFDKIIHEKISVIVQTSIDKLKMVTKDALGQVQLPLGNDEFHKEIDQHFEQVFDKASKTMQEIARDGNISKASAIAKLASTALAGLQSNVIEFCIGVITKNVIQTQESLKKLSVDLNIDFDLLESIVEIMMNGYNPDVPGQDELLGQLEIQIKRLFRKMIPTMDVEPIGDLLHILIKGDISKMKRFLEELEDNMLPDASNAAIERLGKQHSQVSKIYSQLFKMLIYQTFDDKQNFKNEIISLLNQIQEDGGDPQVQKTLSGFKTLQLLWDGRINCLIEDIDKLDQVNEKSNQLQFPQNFPLLFLVAFSKKSSTLANTVIGHALKEITFVTGIITEQERRQQIDKSLTSDQTQDPIEKLFMSLYIALNGITQDMGSIGAAIQKKDPDFDVGLLKIIHLCSDNSPGSFESIIYSLNCAKNIKVLRELYDIIKINPVEPVYILKKLEVDEEKGKVFLVLVYTLYNILKFELLYKQSKENKNTEEDYSHKAQFGNSEFSSIKKKLLKLIPQLRTYFKMVGFFNHSHFKKMSENELNQLTSPKPNNRNLIMSADNNSSRGSIDSQQIEDLEDQELPGFNDYNEAILGQQEQNEERKIENLIIKIFQEPSQNMHFEYGYHQKIWEILTDDEKLKKVFKNRALIVIRCIAIIMVRNDFLLSQENKDYVKCIKKLAEDIEIDSEKLEFLVDIISGDPLDIFKASPKQPSYSIKNEDLFAIAGQNKNEECFINARFDSLRMNLLEQLFQANKQYLPFACLKWYHHQRFFAESKKQVNFLLKLLGVKREFYEIMQLIKIQNQGSIKLNQKFISDQFINYMDRQFTNFAKNQGVQPNPLEYPITSEIFQDVKNKINPNENIQLNTQRRFVEEVERMNIQDMVGPGGLVNIMQNLLKIKQIKRKTIYNILYGPSPDVQNRTREQKQKEHNINILAEILDGVRGESNAAKSLKILYNISALVQAFSYKSSVSSQERTLFIQFGLLCCAAQFKSICEIQAYDKSQMEKSLDLIITQVNTSRNAVLINKLEQIEQISHENYPKLLSTLYFSGFFQELSTKIFSFLDSGATLNDKQCNAIIGLLFGAALKDLELTRFSAIQLLESHALNLGVLTGLAAALTGDIKSEVSLKQFCKTAELDGTMLMNVLDYISMTPQSLPLVLTYMLSYLTRDQQKTCGSLIHVIKKDISMCTILATRLGTTPQQLIPVLACATGDFSILSEHYRSLANRLSIENPYTVQCIIELVHGRDEQIQKLSKIKSKRFAIDQPELVSSVFIINYFGKQFYESYIKDIASVNTLGNSFQVIVSKIKNEFNLNPETANKITKFVNIIIPSCWGSNQALKETLKVLRKLPSNSIWSEKFQETPKEMGLKAFTESELLAYLARKLKKVASDISTLQQKTRSEQKKILSNLIMNNLFPELDKILEDANDKNQRNQQQRNQKIDQLGLIFQNSISFGQNLNDQEYLTENVESLEPNIRLAYQIGCTYSYGLNSKFKQPFYICLDCNEQLGDNLQICVVCIKFCHAGHNIKIGNFGEPGKIICHCGGGKFNNKISNLNKQNPIEMQRNKRICNQVRPIFQVFQRRAIAETFFQGDTSKLVEDLYKSDKSKIIFISDNEDNYTTFEFIKDLHQAFSIPNYFNLSNPDDFFKIQRLKDLAVKNHLRFCDGITYLEDQQLGIHLSLIEQVILLGYGKTTQSFISLLASKQYSYDDYLNQNLYQIEGKGSAYLTQFRTLSAFIAISSADIPKVQEFGDSLAEALEESGPYAVSNICNLIRLAKGGKLPSLRLFELKSAKQTNYMKLFEILFGSVYQRVLAVHILLQQPSDKLVKIMGVEKSLESESEQSRLEVSNIKEWVDQQLFINSLQLEEKPKEYVRNMIGLACRNMNSFDFVMREMKIHPQIITQYKAIIQKDVKELQPIFEKLKKMIPVKFNNFMLNVWEGEKDAVIKFIIQYLVINKTQKNWDSFDEDKGVQNDLLERQTQQQIYLNQIYSLMSEETAVTIIESVLQKMYYKKLNDLPILFEQQKTFFYKKASYSICCIQSVFYGTVFGISDIVHVLFDEISQMKQNEEYQKWLQVKKEREGDKGNLFGQQVPKAPAEAIIKSLSYLVNGCWSNEDIITILEAINVTPFYTKDLPMSYFVNVLLACEGDLVALAKIDDEVCQNGSTHIKSLLASILCGQSKFENLQEEIYQNLQNQSHINKSMPKISNNNLVGEEFEKDANLYSQATLKAQMQKNLLIREIYRIYEKISNLDGNWTNQNHMGVQNFIKWSFDQKVPLYLLMILSQNYIYIEKLFRPEEEFVSNLKENQIEQHKDQIMYLRRLIAFFDPYTDDNSIIQRILSTVMGAKSQIVRIKKVSQVPRFAALDAQNDLLLKPLTWEEEENFHIVKNESEEQVQRMQPVKVQNQILLNIMKDLDFKNEQQAISVNLLSFSKLLSASYQSDSEAIDNLFQVFVKLYDNDTFLQNIYGLMYKIASKKKDQTLNLFSAVTALIVASSKRKQLEKADALIVMMISLWLHALTIMLDKERKFHGNDDLVRNVFKEALDFTIKSCEGQELPLAKYKNDLFYVVDVLFGIMSICKHDFKQMRSIAVKVGGFPSIQKLESFFYLIKKNKEVIAFEPVVKIAPAILDIIPEENTAIGMDTRAIFNFFAKKGQGKIGIEDFQNAVQYMGISLSVPEQLMIFSKADINKSGDLNFSQFLRAIAELKKIVITQAISNLGLSIADLVRAFITSIVILILLFVFIFVSINAFTYPSSFSSITNSILPIIAGVGASSSKNKNREEGDTQYQDAVDDIIN